MPFGSWFNGPTENFRPVIARGGSFDKWLIKTPLHQDCLITR